jgi:predicted DNA-binding WGR domain protein
MLKLYKRARDVTKYWEAWSVDHEVTIHWGILGEIGETRTIQAETGKSVKSIITRESKSFRREGYKAIPISKLAQVVIQYEIDGMGTTDDLARRIQVENVMNNFLGWRGLGHCDGGDIGSGTMNVFCYVVDAAKAIPHIVQELRSKGLIDGAIIANALKSGTTVAWPEDFSGEFLI